MISGRGDGWVIAKQGRLVVSMPRRTGYWKRGLSVRSDKASLVCRLDRASNWEREWEGDIHSVIGEKISNQ